MSILDQNYLDKHQPGINCDPIKQHEHAVFKPISSLDDIKGDSAAASSLKTDHIIHNTNNMPSAGGLLFGSYVVQHYSDGNYETSHLIDLLAKIVPPTIDSGYYYKFVHLYNCARSRYEDIVLSSVSCDIDSFTKKDFEELDDFINNVGSIFDDLVTHILTFVLESD